VLKVLLEAGGRWQPPPAVTPATHLLHTAAAAAAAGLLYPILRSYGHYDVLKVLLEAGGNPLLLDCRGRTALDLARRPQTHPGEDSGDGDGVRGTVDKSRLVALLEQHMAK
jgi:hypothetical protein